MTDRQTDGETDRQNSPRYTASALAYMQRGKNVTRSSAIAKSTVHPSCLVGVLYDISQQKIC